MSLRSTGSTLSYKSQQSSTLSHIKTSNEKLPTVTFVKSNHIHYDPPDKIGINYIQLKISQLYSDHEVRTATSYSYIVRVECNRPDNVWIMRRNVAGESLKRSLFCITIAICINACYRERKPHAICC